MYAVCLCVCMDACICASYFSYYKGGRMFVCVSLLISVCVYVCERERVSVYLHLYVCMCVFLFSQWG